MSEREFKNYQRTHNYSSPADVEKGKIKRETKNHSRHRKKSKESTKNMLRNIKMSCDFDESLAEEVELENEKAAKEYGNAKTHKKRYKKFASYEDFN